MTGGYAIRIIAGNRHAGTAFDGQWVVEYDPTRAGVDPHGRPMVAHLVCSPDPAQAKRFTDWVQAHALYVTPSGQPFPFDRPLTAFTVEVVNPDAPTPTATHVVVLPR